MFKKIKNCAVLLIATCVLSTSFSSLQSAQETTSPITFDFTSVAKEAIPAVVSIKIKAKAKQKTLSFNSWGNSDENDPFGGDFFKRFFSVPNGREPETQQIEGQASGFIVSADGLVLTNSHVVEDATEIIVSLNDGRDFTAKLIGQDPNTDIAVIKIEATDLPFLKLGSSDDLQPGQWAIAVGNPLGLQATLTVGVISATGRNDLDISRIEDFIQTDAAINKGNSGGPLLDIHANVIGMNTAIVANASTGGYMGIGFAIPSNMLKHVLDELVSTGKVTRGFLGIVMQQMDAGLAKAFNLNKTEGALVAEVTKDSPAEKAGLKQGDIILKYNKQPVNNISTLRNAVAMMKPGTDVNFTVLRDGKTMDISINIGTFPVEVAQKATETNANKYGFNVQDLTPEIAQKLGYKEEKGVVIAKVDSGSPAAWAGLKAGILVVAVNKNNVSSVDEFNKALEQIQKGMPLLMLIKQDNVVRFVSLQVD